MERRLFQGGELLDSNHLCRMIQNVVGRLSHALVWCPVEQPLSK